MKKIILVAAIALFGITSTQAQSKKMDKKSTKSEAPKLEGAGIVFEEETIDYGKISHNADGKREFKFTNNGNKPLVISNAQGSCGCTVPTFPKDPIAPGASAVIGVKYDTNRIGAFTKTVTLTTNVSDTPKVLTIKGEILPDAPAEGTTPATKS
ncbi:MAG: hypothetical protein CFE24_10790 [Flavobacterium sp. BFFFF2]|nr:MAG: hypothetical protein CFE24_10790 [Flavobacterium sp. BFFFF2]